ALDHGEVVLSDGKSSRAVGDRLRFDVVLDDPAGLERACGIVRHRGFGADDLDRLLRTLERLDRAGDQSAAADRYHNGVEPDADKLITERRISFDNEAVVECAGHIGVRAFAAQLLETLDAA